MSNLKFFLPVAILTGFFIIFPCFWPAEAAYRFADFRGRPPIHRLGGRSARPAGLTPAQIKKVYRLPASGGRGVIAIIAAYDNPNIEKDLNVFSREFNLPACTSANGCLEKRLMGKTKTDAGWAMETSLDAEWAHAIAPSAKILLVEAKTPSGKNLLEAIDYASRRSQVVAVSMSWGGAEFSDEASLDDHFNSQGARITYFASSGDNGAGVSWPAASPYVVAVGGTRLNFSSGGNFKSETAWSGSGGGVSAYEQALAYQLNYAIPRAGGRRAVPDVAYDADPSSGFSIYYSNKSQAGWYVVGGTSAGAPQWAAIKALGLSANNAKFYADKNSDNNGVYFRDIKSGSNGDCGYFCQARKRYDYVTGLGSPLTVDF